jgi:maltose alpha-D-glucosyltransferase/alpha-amylase
MADTTGSTWYRDGVFYELHVRAYADSNGDGIGDFPGLIGKLDYLSDLGVTAVWLLPFFPSPLLDDGYDISGYTDVHPAYGTLDDVRGFIDAAHERGLRVIIELVLNHTSDQHDWFQRARRSPKGSPERDFYVWSDSPEKYGDARVIFKDYEQSNWTWDPLADAWFWHRFYSHQPDLNYQNPAVREAIAGVVDFWLEMGVDGLRLDAVPYLAEREGTTSENLPETHTILKELRARIDAKYPDRMLLAEANQWPEDAVTYFGDGDECHMAFHFPLMPRLFMALRTEDRLPVVDIMEQTPPLPEGCQWALFLRNHDELTLEMVTEEERLFMYRAYARAEESRINLGIRHRLAPLLGNSRRRIELMNSLLFSMPGTPVIYYGDEIGMGDNIYLGDRDGVRTPMQWSADRNAGFSRAPQQQLYLPLIVDYEYHHDTVHVEAQERNSHSLLAFMKRLLALRQRYPAFGRGDIRFLQPVNRRILAFIREDGGEPILVVANLSRFSQAFELDLSGYAGHTPVELFGRSLFWEIDDRPYRLTLGPHAFSWFALVPASEAPTGARSGSTLSMLEVTGSWREVLASSVWRRLEETLPGFLGQQQWFRGDPAAILDIRILDMVPLPGDDPAITLALIVVTFADRDPETCLLAFQIVPRDGRHEAAASSVIAGIRSGEQGEAVLVDAIAEGSIRHALGWLPVKSHAPVPGISGELRVRTTDQGAKLLPDVTRFIGTGNRIDAGEPGDTTMVVKFLRRISEGRSPEWEIGHALTQAGFAHTPTVLGAIEYHGPSRGATTLAVLQAFVSHEGDAQDWALDCLDTFLAGAAEHAPAPNRETGTRAAALMAAARHPAASGTRELIEPALPFARRIGERLGDLHGALAGIDHPAFAPEPVTPFAQRSIFQSMRGLVARTRRGLEEALPGLGTLERDRAQSLLQRGDDLLAWFAAVLDQALTGVRIRVHGDFHLGQILRTGDDLVIADFEGNADRFIDERRLKESPLRDVADVLYSLRYAVALARAQQFPEPDHAEAKAASTALLATWYSQVGGAVLAGWRSSADEFLQPTTDAELATLLDCFLLEKAVSQVAYQVDHRGDEIALALGIVLDLLDEAEPG